MTGFVLKNGLLQPVNQQSQSLQTLVNAAPLTASTSANPVTNLAPIGSTQIQYILPSFALTGPGGKVQNYVQMALPAGMGLQPGNIQLQMTVPTNQTAQSSNVQLMLPANTALNPQPANSAQPASSLTFVQTNNPATSLQTLPQVEAMIRQTLNGW
jgi:hypothetical protein